MAIEPIDQMTTIKKNVICGILPKIVKMLPIYYTIPAGGECQKIDLLFSLFSTFSMANTKTLMQQLISLLVIKWLN